MCVPCCDNTYLKYLDKENGVKHSYLETLGTNVSVTHTPDMEHPLTQWLLDQGKQPPINTTIKVDEQPERPFCMCICHREDLAVCH